MEIHHLAPQIIALSITTDKLSDGGGWYTLRCKFGHSGFDVVVVCRVASDAKDTLKSNLSGQELSVEIRLESHFKPPPNVAWIQFAKTAFHVDFCCPDFLNTI